MRLPVQQFITISAKTYTEAVRQPVFLLLALSTLVFTGALPFIITHVIGESQRIVRDSALALQLVSGLFLGCYAAASTLSREIRRGTLAAMLSKPVDRATLFLAKYCGSALAAATFCLMSTLAIMLAVRTSAVSYVYDPWGSLPLLAGCLLAFAAAGLMNFLFQTPFVSRAWHMLLLLTGLAFLVSCAMPGRPDATGFGTAIPWEILPAGILILAAVLVLTGIAVTVAIRIDLPGAMVLCSLLLMLGLLSDYLLGSRSGDHLAARIAYALVPNWQNFWAVDALVHGSIAWSYVGHAFLYGAVYLAGVLAFGLILMDRGDVRR